jgi:DNA-binding HxlR family transcriptional regulator
LTFGHFVLQILISASILTCYTLQKKVGTAKYDTYQKESVNKMPKISQFTAAQIAEAKAHNGHTSCDDIDPRIEALVNDLIGRVADKWTMLILEVLEENGELRFTKLSKLLEGISQKMLTQTLRHMERDGLVTRTVHPVVPPKVEYKLTPLGMSLGAAFCGVWLWAEENLKHIEQARCEFDEKAIK